MFYSTAMRRHVGHLLASLSLVALMAASSQAAELESAQYQFIEEFEIWQYPSPETALQFEEEPDTTASIESPEPSIEQASTEDQKHVKPEAYPAPTSAQPAEATALEAEQKHLNTAYSMRFGKALAEISKVHGADYAVLSKFYEIRENQPLFLRDGKLTDHGKALLERVEQAETDGLRPQDYVLPEFSNPLADDKNISTEIVQELQLAKTALTYARHLARGRVNPASLSENITLRPAEFDGLAAMQDLASNPSLNAAFDALAPQHPYYAELKGALTKLLAERAAAPEIIAIPEGRMLRPDAVDNRVPLLRARFGLIKPQSVAENKYDAGTVAMVMAFQKDNGLKEDGIIGPNTLLYLNKNIGSQIELVTLNMERWRWMPLDLGRFHVKVNIPEYTGRIFKDNAEIYDFRVIVGQPKHETPIFSDEIEHIVVNPYWHVPYSIASKEILPKVQADPSYLTRNGYEVVYTGSGKPRQVSPNEVNWAEANPKSLPLRFRQTPGRGNALGDVKFMFPNRHSVYLHDTPSRGLFARTSRALSHGCIRVQEPFKFAEALLQEEPRLSGAQLLSMRGDKERTVHLEKHVPVHLMYFTAIVEPGGELRVFNDIYGHDRTLAKALQQNRAKPLHLAADF